MTTPGSDSTKSRPAATFTKRCRRSGTGHFGRVDRATGQFEPLTFCPGYLRGLSFVGDYAVVGLSQCRENRTFQGLALDDNLKSHDAEAHCGLCVIDLRTGDLVHFVAGRGRA